MTLSLEPEYDEAFKRKRQPWVMYPLILMTGGALLFPLLGGGEGLGSSSEQNGRLMGFNTNVPTAEDTDLKGKSIDHPAYGSRPETGQRLSRLTNTKALPAANQLQAFPDDAATAQAASYSTTSANAANPPATTTGEAMVYSTPPSTVKTRRGRKNGASYNYHPAQPYYVNSNQTDQQLENQLDSYQAARQAANTAPSNQLAEPGAATSPKNSGHSPNLIQLADNTTASRLDQSGPSPVVESPFNTAPVGNSRQQEIASTLQSTGYNQRSVITLIPAVIHDDQSVKAGQTVKIRLTRAVVIDGIRVPANTIIHASCLPDGDRLRLIVQNLQLGSQLIPLDLEAVDMDGGTGLNAPGLSDQLGGQIKSSAVQGVNIPTRSMLVNTVLNAARFGASSQVRQSQIHLKGGYHLNLKAI